MLIRKGSVHPGELALQKKHEEQLQDFIKVTSAALKNAESKPEDKGLAEYAVQLEKLLSKLMDATHKYHAKLNAKVFPGWDELANLKDKMKASQDNMEKIQNRMFARALQIKAAEEGGGEDHLICKEQECDSDARAECERALDKARKELQAVGRSIRKHVDNVKDMGDEDVSKVTDMLMKKLAAQKKSVSQAVTEQMKASFATVGSFHNVRGPNGKLVPTPKPKRKLCLV